MLSQVSGYNHNDFHGVAPVCRVTAKALHKEKFLFIGQIATCLEPRGVDSHAAPGIAAQQSVGQTSDNRHVTGHVSRRCRQLSSSWPATSSSLCKEVSMSQWSRAAASSGTAWGRWLEMQ